MGGAYRSLTRHPLPSSLLYICQRVCGPVTGPYICSGTSLYKLIRGVPQYALSLLSSLQFLLILGFIVMIIGTTTIIRDKLRPMDEDSTTGKYVYPRPFVPPAPIVEVKGPEIVEDFKLPPAGGLPLPGDNDIINNDIIVEDVMHQQVVPAAVDLSPNEKRVKENADIEEVREIGDGVQSEGVNGERVEGGEGKGLKDEHESIKKDMEELKERIKAVEEENQELKVTITVVYNVIVFFCDISANIAVLLFRTSWRSSRST